MAAEGTKRIATKELFANAAFLIVCEMGGLLVELCRSTDWSTESQGRWFGRLIS